MAKQLKSKDDYDAEIKRLRIERQNFAKTEKSERKKKFISALKSSTLMKEFKEEILSIERFVMAKRGRKAKGKKATKSAAK